MKRLTALVMAILMMVSILPADALAAGRNNGHGKGNDQVVDTSESVHLPALQEETVKELSSRTGLGRIKVHSGKNALPKRASVRFSSASADEERIFDFLKGNNGMHKGQLKKAAKAPAKGRAAEPETEYRVLAMYDISVEKSDQSEWQPDGETVRVEVELETPVPVNEGESLTLVHIDDDGNMADAGGSFTIEDGMLKAFSFNAEGFSVYAIVGEDLPQPPRVTYEFIDPNNPNFTFVDKAGNQQTTQIIKDGEVLQDVGLPTINEGETFSGWYLYNGNTSIGAINFGSPISISYGTAGAGSQLDTGSIVIDPSELNADKTLHVTVKAYFGDVVYLTFYEDAAGTNILTRHQIPKGGSFDISTIPVSSPESELAFGGWAATAGTNDDNRTAITPTSLTNIEADRAFYPIFKSGHWITFYAGATGSGATYTAPLS